MLNLAPWQIQVQEGNQSPMWVTSQKNPTINITHFEKWT